MLPSIRKIWGLLRPHQRRKSVLVFSLMLVGMVMEMVGLGMVIPVLTILTDNNKETSSVGAIIVSLSGHLSHTEIITVGMIVLVGVYVVKTTFLAFLTWQQAKFVFGLQVDLSKRLFRSYITQPYTFHLQRNSAQLIQNVFNETHQFAQGVLISGIALLTELLVVVGILILLLAIEPLGAVIVAAVLGLTTYFFQRISRERLLRWGIARQNHDGMRIQHLQQGLGGVKEVKLFGSESHFINQFAVHTLGSAHAWERQTVLQALPRIWLEMLGVIGLAGIVLVMLWQGKPVDNLVPTLGLFAAAAFRLIPSVNRILISAQKLRFGLPSTKILSNELSLPHAAIDSAQADTMFFGGEIVIDNVSYSYPGAPEPSLRDVSMTIPRGTSIGIVGGSGAGKSTLVDVLLGLLTPTAGRIRVDGVDIQSNTRGWQSLIGYVPQTIYLMDDTIRHNIAFGVSDSQINDEAVWRAVCAAQLEEYIKSLPNGLDTVIGEGGVRLSGGQRQRVGIARALYYDPPVLVLDEATSALDTLTEQDFVEAVNALSGRKTLIIVAHRLSTLKCCDRLYRLDKGCIVEEGNYDTVSNTINKR